MIDLAINNLYLLGTALAIGIVTGRWAFSSSNTKTANATPPEPEQEDAQP